MGAWGHGSFENDVALDWMNDFANEGGSIDLLKEALHLDVHGADTYLDSEIGMIAVAAAELVAASRDGSTKGLPERARRWVDHNGKHLGENETGLSRRAIERVLGASSELADLQSENPNWRPTLQALLARLG